ncbi:MAG: ATP-dependent zinc metalloprotease FtsH [bacterium ADurb.Bin243]|nr:MAG: ATP-dependent zinc metalloprotease FtsH [bacterium ADurb.Bin243]
MSSEMLKNLDIFVRARYPIIYITTFEEGRADDYLIKIGRSRNKKVISWSQTRGLMPAGTGHQNAKSIAEGSGDPMCALDYVMNSHEPAIFIFHDFHPFLNDSSVIRRLREISIAIKESFKTLVLVSPVLKIPCELEKDINVVDFPMPSLSDMAALLNKMISDISDNRDIKISIADDERELILQALLGLTISEAENVIAKALVKNGALNAASIGVILSEKEQIIRKSNLLEYYNTSENIDDVGGLDSLKHWLNLRKQAFSEKARNFGLPSPRGILMLGVQGCGKSLCAKAVSALWQIPLLRLDMGKIFSSLIGSSEENIRRAVKVAESIAPAILWIDEIDKGFNGMNSGNSDAGTSSRVFGTFLTWMQEKKSPVFVIATANNISLLPPELLRKGRFDEIFFVDLPEAPERAEIFKIHLKKREIPCESFDMKAIVEASEGFSGAEIEQAIIASLFEAFYKNEGLKCEFLLKALEQTVPLSKTMKEEIDSLRSWAASRAVMASRPVDAVEGARPKRRLEF